MKYKTTEFPKSENIFSIDVSTSLQSFTQRIPDDDYKVVETSTVKMFSLFGISVLYFIKILSGYRNLYVIFRATFHQKGVSIKKARCTFGDLRTR